MNKSLTIVLPVYNAESSIGSSVEELLEVSSELTSEFSVLIIDDGSTDASFEVAEELAARYPQVSVRRHRHRRGLGATLEYVRRRVRSDAVMVHDGVSPIDPKQVGAAWRRWIAQLKASEQGSASPIAPQRDRLELAELAAAHSTMQRAHERVLGFQLVSGRGAQQAPAAEATPTAAPGSRADGPHSRQCGSVGQIPPPPRARLLTALADFAFGE